MANRFLDTNYYKSNFVRSLKGALKSLYSFIICDCDPSGMWNFDLQAAALYTGFETTPQEFEYHFVETGKAIHLGKLKFFFPDFIEHQYPQGLGEKNPAHKNVIKNLQKIGALDDNFKLKNKGALKELHSPTGLCIGLSNGMGIGNKGGVGEIVVYNAEEEILKNQIEFERICMASNKDLLTAKDSLHKFHLHLLDKEQYPKGRKSVFAGFEKWLLNEKNFVNGSATHKPNTTTSSQKLGTSDARTEALRKW